MTTKPTLSTSSEVLLSVGRVAEATGLTPDTLRVWERRYGQPRPVRLPSGHRRYTSAQVRWLRRVSEALSRRMRPSDVLSISEDELDALLARGDMPFDEEVLSRWIGHVRNFERQALLDALAAEHAETDLCTFFETRVTPLLQRVGRGWADGEFEIRHEHFLTEVLLDVLRSTAHGHRANRPARPGAPLVLLATLPGEDHELGLQMLASLCAESGVPTRLLGTNCPVAEVVGAVDGVDAVALSVSLSSGGLITDRLVSDLRQLLPPELPLCVGGAGARRSRRGVRGVRYFERLAPFLDWLETAWPRPAAGPAAA